MITVIEENPIYSRISNPEVVKPFLNVKKVYWKSTGYRKERIEYLKYLVDRNGTFLTGFIPKIKQNVDCKLDLIDYDIKSKKPSIKGITFREDQLQQIQAALKAHRGVLLAPTGSGKTVLIAGLISCYPKARILFLVHTIDLVDQAINEFKKFGFKNISKMGGGSKDFSGRIVVSSIQTFSSLDREQYCDEFDMVFSDECFHKDTKVKTKSGDKCIKDLKMGDNIYSKNGLCKIKNIFINKIPLNEVVRLNLNNGKTIFCSKDHLFFSEQEEWIKAKDLYNKFLFTFPKNHNMVSDITLYKNGEENDIKNKKTKIHLLKLWKKIYRLCIFQKENLLKAVSRKNPFFNNVSNKSKICIKKNDKKESNAQPGNYRKNEKYKTNKWDFEYLVRRAWRKWKIYSTTNSFSYSFRVANGGGDMDRLSMQQNKYRIPLLLQSRYWQQRIKNSNRSRWERTSYKKSSNYRQQKDTETNGIRVESVEIYQRGNNDKSFSNIITDKERNQNFIEFYDFETNDHPSYFAEGVLVHNCHHINGLPDKSKPEGSMYYKVLSNLLAPIRFGVTATLSSNQEARMCMEGLLGPVISELSFEEAKDLDILAVPKIKLIKVEPFFNYDIRTYADIYEAAIVQNKERNIKVLQTIKELNEEGLSTVTYVQKINHIENLLLLADRMNIPLQEVQGSTSGEDRGFIKENLHKKKIMNVVSTIVWREGLNIKSLNAIILAGGGKNEKDLIQAVGRGARKDKGKDEFVIVDFIDNSKYLSQHFCERLGVYVSKGWI